MLDENKTLDWDAGVLGGGKRFHFYANKKANYRNEKQAYDAYTPYELAIPFLRLFQVNSSKEENSSVFEDS